MITLILWGQWDLVVAAAVSFGSFLWLATVTIDPARFFIPEVGEMWLALFTLVLTMVILSMTAIKVLRTSGSKKGQRFIPGPSGAFLVTVLFVSMTSPLLVPVDPVQQGNLVTTRLLPPLAAGYRYDRPTVDAPIGTETGALGMYRHSTRIILERKQAEFSGDPEGSTETESRFLFLFGTDDLGRDVFSRVLYGARVSLLVGGAAALGAVMLGGLIGFVAGNAPGPVDSILMRFTDMALSIPAIFLVISLVAFLGSSVSTLVIALSITGWMSTAKMIRNEVSSLRQREFILSARLLRRPATRIILDHMLPNVAPLLLVALVLQFSGAVLAEASLGFLGLGIQPPTPTWGTMMGDATAYLAHAWWPGFFPGLVLSGVVIAAHFAASRLEVSR